MDLSLNNRRALVCGSTQGIGKSIALELAALGANVTLLSRNEAKLQEVLRQLPRTELQQHGYVVADNEQIAQFSRTVNDFARANPVNILVNNTGGPPAGAVYYAAEEEFLRAFSSHLICNHILAKACVEGMKISGYGRIINIISTSVKQPLPGLGVSNTVRAAVANWSKTLALELGEFGITVNNVLPGATATQRLAGIIENKRIKSGRTADEIRNEMLHEIPLRRFAAPEEVASAVAFLASPAAAYITGINLPVDGGRTQSL